MALKLTQIARKILQEHFSGDHNGLDKDTKKRYEDEKACFVTLEKNGQLRGCIGSLEPNQELWKEVAENAFNAAFYDSRFPPLDESELSEIIIEVSVLTTPIKLSFVDEEHLLPKLNEDMGIILRNGIHSATFLPQVWKQIPEKIDFLQQLSLKAGLDENGWKSSDIYFYKVEIEKEKSF